MTASVTYIVFLEECEVANDSHPHQEGGGSQQYATQVIGGHVLMGEREDTSLAKNTAESQLQCTLPIDTITTEKYGL